MEEDSPQATTLSKQPAGATIRRIKFIALRLLRFTHTANNAMPAFWFQKSFTQKIAGRDESTADKNKTGRPRERPVSQGEGYSVLSLVPFVGGRNAYHIPPASFRINCSFA
jgi:hypothetical protein